MLHKPFDSWLFGQQFFQSWIRASQTYNSYAKKNETRHKGQNKANNT